mgnify:FL=1|tara:strand:- start:777 stop:1376 length:600 start_codon:yes stop_codon:yes gene_type:complete
MNSIKLDKQILKDLVSLGKKRHEAKDISFRNHSKHGRFRKYKGDSDVTIYDLTVTKRHIPHIAGVIGEFAYGKLIGEDVDRKIYSVRDDGVDFKNGAEVKTSTFYTGSFGQTELKIPKREYIERSPSLYVLARLNSKVLLKSPNEMIVDILGQISNNKFDSLKQEKQYIEGGPINYVVKQSDLDPVKVVEKPWFFDLWN